jgi:hypothetical protein
MKRPKLNQVRVLPEIGAIEINGHVIDHLTDLSVDVGLMQPTKVTVSFYAELPDGAAQATIAMDAMSRRARGDEPKEPTENE